jgi:hypothetical protein
MSMDRGRHADPASSRDVPWVRRTRPRLGVVTRNTLLFFWVPVWALAGGVGLLKGGHRWWLNAIGVALVALGLAGLGLLTAYLRRPTAR